MKHKDKMLKDESGPIYTMRSHRDGTGIDPVILNLTIRSVSEFIKIKNCNISYYKIYISHLFRPLS